MTNINYDMQRTLPNSKGKRHLLKFGIGKGFQIVEDFTHLMHHVMTAAKIMIKLHKLFIINTVHFIGISVGSDMFFF